MTNMIQQAKDQVLELTLAAYGAAAAAGKLPGGVDVRRSPRTRPTATTPPPSPWLRPRP